MRGVGESTIHRRGADELPLGDLHRFDDAGLIVQTWNLMDGLALVHQLGLLPSA